MASKVSGIIERIKTFESDGAVEHSLASTAYGLCESLATRSDKEVEMTGFELNEGVTVHIKFVNENLADNPPTLNIAGTGAKPIVQYGSTAVGTISDTSGWQAGAVLTLTYDGISWVRDQGYNSHAITGIKGDAEVSYRTGNVNLTAANIGAATTDHTHGNITNGGSLQTNDVTIGQGDKLIITDSSNSGLITRSSLAFSGTIDSQSTSTKFLREDGTWQTPSYISNISYGNISTSGTISQSNNWQLGTDDGLVVFDSSNSNKLERSGILFDASTETEVLSKKGTWVELPSIKLITGNISSTVNTNVNNDNVCLRLFNNDVHINTIQLEAGNNISITNEKVDNTDTIITINATDTTYIFDDNYDATNNHGATVATVTNAIANITPSSLGLSNALKLIGQATQDIMDGGNQHPTIEGQAYSGNNGDVIIDKDGLREYVWLNGEWLLLGYTASTIYAQPSGDPQTNTWISKITQGTDGKITATLGSLVTTGSWEGTAETAKKWTSAQTVYVNLASTGTDSTLQGGSNSAVGLKVDGTLGIGSGGTGTNSVTTNGIIYGASLTAYGSTAAGSAGSILIGNGANAAPSWYNGLILTNSGTNSNPTYEIKVNGAISFKENNSYSQTYGNLYTPIYWSNGKPATTTPIQKISFTFNHTYPSEIHLSHDAITKNTCISEIVVTSGFEYLHSSISWEVITNNNTSYLKLSTTSAITNVETDAKTISGYVIIGQTTDTNPTYLSLS